MIASNSGRRKNACQCLIVTLNLAVCLTLSARAAGQERVDPMAATVAPWFAMIEQSFIALADAMPAEKYGFKPTTGAFNDVRTFGEQVKHVACGNFAFFNEIEKKEPPNGVRDRRATSGNDESRADGVLARIVRVCRPGPSNDDAGQRARARGWAVQAG